MYHLRSGSGSVMMGMGLGWGAGREGGGGALLDGDHVVLGELGDGLGRVHARLVRRVQRDRDLVRRPAPSSQRRIPHPKSQEGRLRAQQVARGVQAQYEGASGLAEIRTVVTMEEAREALEELHERHADPPAS